MAREKAVGYDVEKYFAGRKRAFRSKPSEGIVIKKKKKNWISDEIPGGTKKSHDLRSSVQKTIEEPIPVGYGTIDDYECLNRISSGSYGAVYKARHAKTGEIVAVKKEFDALSQSTRAEIKILSSLNHPSIVGFKEVVVDDRGGMYVVMEYAEDDLEEYIHDTEYTFTLARVKCLMKELLEGVEYLHERCRVIHMDLKPSNILIDDQGKLKICDFGMSRKIPTASDPLSTTRFATLWYSAPELLLGEYSMYSAAVDMWSVGCIMAEFFLREELFTGWSESQQLQTITKILEQPRCLHDKFEETTPFLSEAGFDLLCQLLAFDPDKRITARDALKHDWFHK